MDFETQRRKRMEALEDKKKRLEEMRKMRKDRVEGGPEGDISNQISIQDSRVDVDDLINSLLVNDLSSISISSAETGNEKVQDGDVISNLKVSRQDFANERKNQLRTVRPSLIINIPPTIAETYEKECQTDSVDDLSNNDERNSDSFNNESSTTKSNFRRSHTNSLPRNNPITPTSLNFEHLSTTPSPIKITKKLSQDDQKQIIHSEHFKKFVSHSSRVVERALGQSTTFDIFKDYSTDNDIKLTSLNQTLKYLNSFEDEYVRNRPVMEIQNSPHHDELFLAAYGAKGQAFHNRGAWQLISGSEDDPAGLVCIWSLALQSRPEFKFTSSSPVLTASFHSSEQHLVIGGCYSGQILLWDMRAKALPVQRSNLAGRGHKHPVYSVALADTGSTPELISASTDGTICHWDSTRLSEPTNSYLLQSHAHVLGRIDSTLSATSTASSTAQTTTSNTSLDISRNVCVSAMSFGQGNNCRDVVVGCENGKLFRTSLPFRTNDTIKQVDAHLGLVTAMHTHPNPTKAFKNLLLTSSLDWTVKLWNLHTTSEPILELFNTTYDYVCDVKWSPVHPSVFATVTSGGMATLWNLSKSVIEPMESISIIQETEKGKVGGGGGGTTGGSNNSAALNRIIWSSDGRRLMIGDAKGSISVLSVAEAAVKPKVGDEGRFEMSILHKKDVSLTTSGLQEENTGILEEKF